jgi:hypothetical protein
MVECLVGFVMVARHIEQNTGTCVLRCIVLGSMCTKETINQYPQKRDEMNMKAVSTGGVMMMDG